MNFCPFPSFFFFLVLIGQSTQRIPNVWFRPWRVRFSFLRIEYFFASDRFLAVFRIYPNDMNDMYKLTYLGSVIECRKIVCAKVYECVFSSYSTQLM